MRGPFSQELVHGQYQWNVEDISSLFIGHLQIAVFVGLPHVAHAELLEQAPERSGWICSQARYGTIEGR